METKNDKPLLYNKTVESGIFIRTKWQRGKEKRQKTLKIKQNNKKVVLGHIGDLEVYVYPFDYPDKVFLGKYPISTIIDSTNVNSILGTYNQVRWFLSNQAYSKPKKSKGANSRRQAISRAYTEGLKRINKPKMNPESTNYNLKNKDRPLKLSGE